MNMLLNSLFNQLTRTLPSVALKTGHTDRCEAPTESGLQTALDVVMGGTPMLFLDLRCRPKLSNELHESALETLDRKKQITEEVKSTFDQQCNALLDAGTADIFDCMSIAYIYTVVFGYNARRDALKHAGESLHEAIQRLQGRDDSHIVHDVDAGLMLQELVTYIVTRMFQDAWKVRTDRAQLEEKGEHWESFYANAIQRFQALATTLLTHPNFHAVNLYSDSSSHRIMRHLVKLDRLPEEETIEGLRLIRQAWDISDVCMHFAGKYKMIAKALFIAQCCLSIFSVLVTVIHLGVDMPKSTMSWTLFCIATSLGVQSGITAFLNPAQRWKDVRCIGAAAKSTVFQYRTRTGRFVLSKVDPRQPERILYEEIKDCRGSLSKAADIRDTAFSQLFGEHHTSECKHGQYTARMASARTSSKREQLTSQAVNIEEVDDHHSPLKPSQYIAFRLEEMKAFYQSRLPHYSNMRTFLNVTLIVSSAVSAIVAFADQSHYVAVISAFAAALVSWSEFVQLRSKLSRYNNCVLAIDDLVTWWVSLSSVEQSSLEHIDRLVTEGEHIINSERVAWQTTGLRTRLTQSADTEGGESHQEGAKFQVSGASPGKPDQAWK